MKKFACLLVLFSITAIAYPQYLDQYAQVLKTYQDQAISQLDDEYPIGRFAITLHPLGFAQFGPMVGTDIALNERLAISAHYRFTPYGILSYIVRFDDEDGEKVDELTGYSIDAGMLYFFGQKKSKPYAGLFIGYESAYCIYSQNTAWEWQQDEAVPFLMGGFGYRIRSNSGLFVNLGGYFGAGYSTWEWYFTDPTWGSGGSGKLIHPVGMADIAIGIEF